MLNRRNFLVGSALALGLSLIVPEPASAGKPGGTLPKPPGTIFFAVEPEQWRMDGDGSNKRLLAPGDLMGTPSSRQYGNGYRWSLYVAETGQTYDRVRDSNGNVIITNWPQAEVFASRPDGTVVKLTSLYGDVSAHGNLVWSNDGEDSFVSFRCWYLADAFQVAEDGSTELDSTKVRDAIVRLPVSGAQLGTAGSWVPLGPADREIVVSSDSGYEGNFRHHWSPDGTQVVYVLDPTPTATEQAESLWVTDLPTDQTTFLASATWIHNVQWQPGGNLIAFHDSGRPSVWVIHPDGSGARILLEATPAAFCWSPDGNHLAYQHYSRKGFRPAEYQINRYDMATGASITLTGELDKLRNKYPLAWVSNNTAP
jgi:hypothetical protein